MRITLIGPGRAGMALALAARSADHDIAAVAARRLEAAVQAADKLGGTAALPLDADLPPCDLIILATRDGAIATVAGDIASLASAAGAVVHLSGLASISVLDPFARQGLATGSFHPLQTLPTPEAGAARLPGSWIAVTTENEALRSRLHDFARSLDAAPFDLADDDKAVYHAAAAAAANFPLTALAMAADLFEAAGVPFDAAAPLVQAIVANAFDMGPRPALTGPVARGDVGTVAAQMGAVAVVAPEWLDGFKAMVAELAKLTGREEQFRSLLDKGGSSWR